VKLPILTASFVFVATAAAASSFQVTLDTSPLIGPQTIGFALSNFDSASNSVSLSAFDFYLGSVVSGSQDCTIGGSISGTGCGGDLSTAITLEDAEPFAFFTQQFNPGSSLSFTVTTTNSFSGDIPDAFGMFVCDGNVVTCYSDDPSGAMLLLDLSGGPLSPTSFVTFAATEHGLSAPVVTAVGPGPDPAPVPEPGTLLLLSGGLIVMVRRGWQKS